VGDKGEHVWVREEKCGGLRRRSVCGWGGEGGAEEEKCGGLRRSVCGWGGDLCLGEEK
jgi:hypothetical protein